MYRAADSSRTRRSNNIAAGITAIIIAKSAAAVRYHLSALCGHTTHRTTAVRLRTSKSGPVFGLRVLSGVSAGLGVFARRKRARDGVCAASKPLSFVFALANDRRRHVGPDATSLR